MSDFQEAARALKDAADRRDRLAAWGAAGRVVSYLSDLMNPVNANEVFNLVWTGASGNRWFDIAEVIAGAAAKRADATAGTRRLHAQMLMERGFSEEALARLGGLLEDPSLSDDDRGEAYGHIGRINKDRFIAAAIAGDERSAVEFLRKALQGYLTWYETHPTSAWHGVNAAALLARPEARAVEEGAAAKSKRIAEQILKEPPTDSYSAASLAEANVAVGNYAAALERVRSYINTSVSPFALGNFLRQLTQVWGLDRRPSPGPELVALISAALLEREGGVLRLSSEELQRAREVSPAKYEAVFGVDRFDSFENYRRGLERCSCVARIGKSVEVGAGTGFVIPGRLLSDKLDEQFVLMTNAHVISENEAEREEGALHPSEAIVTFAALEGVSPDHEFVVDKVLCSSPREQLDMIVVKLNEPIPPTVAYSPAAVLPAPRSSAPVRVIGHPSGRGLSLSVNQLLDHQAPKLHYRTATEGGSSGSPVFNQEWKLIGLHHAGGEAVQKLNGQAGTYQANEGIWIRSICEAVQRALP